MSGPEWISQTVPALGAITSEGIMQTLGRPAMSRLTVLVREAAQNSWDAKDHSRDDPVAFTIDLRRLRGRELDTWRSLVADSAPHDDHLPLRSTLEESESPLVMFLSDRGTTGLGGPTRADQAIGKVRDYTAFVLNIGEPRDTELGGGTYGFGKSIFFSASRAHSVVVSTRCATEGGEIESRLVGCALGHSFSTGGTNFTGRHWWGFRAGGEQAVEPVRGRKADELAAALGFRDFKEDATGTSIAVLCPELDERSPEEAAEWLVEALLWHLWPKMLGEEYGRPEMTFGVTLDGVDVPVPSPRGHPALRLFAEAFDAHTEGDGEMLLCGNPRQSLGRLALKRILAPPPMLSEVAREAGLDQGLRHVCLMRTANLVVKYHEGPPTADEMVPYAGVFKPLDDLDDIYAAAEPPAHDDWIPDQLQGGDRTFVRQTFTRIKEALKRFTAPADVTAEGGQAAPLGSASRLFAGLLGATTGLGASSTEAEPGVSGARRPVRLVGAPRWEQFEGSDLLVQHLDVQTTRTVTYRAQLGVSVWGSSGGEADPPAATASPRLVGWIDSNDQLHEGEVIAFSAGQNGDWRVAAEPPPDAAVSFGVRQAAREDEAA